MNEQKVKIIRLLSGEDIIAEVEETADSYFVENPVVFMILFNKQKKSQELLMNYWISRNLVIEDKIGIEKTKTLFLLTPNEDFKEYYLNFIYDFNNIEETKNETSLSKPIKSIKLH